MGRPYLLIASAAVLWGLLGVLSKGVLESGVSPLEIAFWRAVLAGGLFVLHAALTSQLRLARRDLPLFIGFALVGVTTFYAAFVLAVAAGGVSLATVLLYAAPAFVVVAAWLLLGEPLTGQKLALVGLATLGVVLVAQGGGQGVTVTPTSLGWGLLAGLCYASYYIFGKWVLGRYTPVAIYAVVLPIGALGLWPLVTFSPKSPAVWGLLLALAFLSTYLAYLLYYTGLRHTEASRAVLIATIEPVVAAGLAALLFGERLGWWGLAGAILVVSASVLANTLRRR
ncbi:MAG: DMT family transporter [Truepera sp.]|nr:DMT family transporter [Truepera sp.]